MTSAEGNNGGGGGSSAAPGSQHTAYSVPTTDNNQPDDSDKSKPSRSHRPADVALKQQRMKSWQPILDPKYVIATYLLIGLIFIPTGIVIRKKNDDLIELKTIYESHLKKGPYTDGTTGCEIGNNANQMWLANPQQSCQIKMQVPLDKGDMQPPVLIHYELFNFYQNYRRYFNSYDQYQLLGSLKQDIVSAGECEPLNIIGGIKINPCGLIANTLFNDVITLESIEGPDGEVIENAPMVETGVAWTSDLEWKYRQPEGFRSEQCSSCDDCDCSEVNDTGERVWSCQSPHVDEDGVCFRYFYPDDDTTQYLYETYPMVVSPLDGVTNEHFAVWMATAALPHFRKLYGYIEQPIPAGSIFTFNIQANFVVERLEGAKALVVSNSYIFGGKNHWLGTLFIAVGSIAAILGLLFLAKDVLRPRRIGDRMYLKFKED
ncbi:hypothetical protein ACHAXR_012113 [Thalassiosira sp. AJA248-18]